MRVLRAKRLTWSAALALAPILLVVSGSSVVQDNADAAAIAEVRRLIRDGSYGEAEAVARRLLGEVQRSSAPEPLRLARALDCLVESLWRGGKGSQPESRPLAERALRLKREKLGPDHVDLAQSLDNLGMLDYAKADYTAAKSYFERSREIRETRLGPDHPDVAWSLSYLGIIAYHDGRFNESRRLHERALSIRERQLSPDHTDVAYSLNNLAILHHETGDYVAARPTYERALAIREKTLGPDHPRVAGVLNNLAVLLVETGDFSTARRVYERALAIREATLDADHPWTAETLGNIANLLRKMGDLEGAKERITKALAIWERTVAEDHLSVASSLDTLGDVEYSMGNLSEAKRCFMRALEIWEKGLRPDHTSVGWGLYRLASVLRDRGDLSTSRRHLERGLGIWEAELGADHPFVAMNRQTLAEVQFALGESDASLRTALATEEIGIKHLRLFARGLAERQSLRYAMVRASGLDMALTLAAEGLVTTERRLVLDALIRSRALVLDEIASRHRVLINTENPELNRLGAELAAARTRLANLTVRRAEGADPERYRMLLDRAREEKEQAERKLARKSSAFRRDEERREIGLDQVARILPAGSALVSYSLYRRYPRAEGESTLFYLAFILRSGIDRPEVVNLGRASEIDALVGRWRDQISRGPFARTPRWKEVETDYRRVGEVLRGRIWDVLRDGLADARLVFLVPDGALNLVSFSALPTAEDRYLVETGPILHYLSAERDLVPTRSETHGTGLLAVGDPDFSESRPIAKSGSGKPASRTSDGAIQFRGERTTCQSFSSTRFERLSGAAAEVQAIAELWKAHRQDEAVEILGGAAASEGNFKARVSGKRGLHLATHGFFLSGDCRSAFRGSRGIGALELAREPEPPVTVGENPLVLSGLAFAGANLRDAAGPDEDDGILTAEEVAALDLSGVEWAVLSGCDTGAGEVLAGEGVLGLRRAFQVAGARTLIMSLWPVSDQSTKAWMQSLYEERLQGRSTADAVRRATVKSLAAERRSGEGAHPFFWAPFVAAGDWH